jgi:hypothetical protein
MRKNSCQLNDIFLHFHASSDLSSLTVKLFEISPNHQPTITSYLPLIASEFAHHDYSVYPVFQFVSSGEIHITCPGAWTTVV